MKNFIPLFSFLLISLISNSLFANQNSIEEYKFDEPGSGTLIGRNIDYRDFLAGLTVKSSIQRTFLNLSSFYEKTAFFYNPGTYGYGVNADLELGLIKYRASLFAESKFSLKRELHDAGFENLETGLKIVIYRAYNDSVSISTHFSYEVVEFAETAYVPNSFYNAGMTFSWGVPFVISIREMLVLGADFKNFTKYLTRTEVEFSRQNINYFGRTSLILGYEYEYLDFRSESNEDHFEVSFTLFNISGIYYTFAWRFGKADEYIYHNRIGIMIKF